MNDMSQAIIPRSDQWNADDFLSGPQTFKITDVEIRGGQEQPVSISVEGSGKVFRPCKSMSRVLVNCWGPDASKYIGRSLTLYTDPSVTWGGMKVGGIRIASMSHIEGPVTMALTATRGNKKAFTVKPMAMQASVAAPPVVTSRPDYRTQGDQAASLGRASFGKFWNGLSREQRVSAGGTSQRDIWVAIATKADESPPPDDEDLDLPSDFDGNTTTSRSEQSNGRDEAAADGTVSVERRAGSPTPQDLEGEPAPDPRSRAPSDQEALEDMHQFGNRPAVDGAANEVAQASGGTPAKADVSPRPGLQEGAGGALPPRVSPAPTDAKSAADEARKARIAEIKRDGQARAESGTAALSNFLEQLRQDKESDLISNVVRAEWRDIAKAADAAKAGARK